MSMSLSYSGAKDYRTRNPEGPDHDHSNQMLHFMDKGAYMLPFYPLTNQQ